MHQTFLVILEVPADFDRYFPKVEAWRMADIIRDGFAAKSCSFLGPVPFTISCQRVEEPAWARGRMLEYSPEAFEEPEEATAHPIGTGNLTLVAEDD